MGITDEVSGNQLAQLHTQTYDVLANEYENRVEALRPVTRYALSMLTSELSPGARILDIGCAVGYTLEILREQGMRPEGIDISHAMVELARKRNPEIEVRKEDFFASTYEDNSYDGVLMYAFIHLFPKAIAMEGIAKVSRILKQKGYAFLSTTLSETSSEGFEVKADYDGVSRRFRKRWTRDEFVQAIDVAGFDIIRQEDLTDEMGKIWMDYVVQKR